VVAPAPARDSDGPASPEVDLVREAISNTGAPLRADDSGKLVLDAKTRERVEAIVTLLDPQDLYAVVEQETRQLPPEAAAQARALVERYKLYLEEQIGAVAPGFAPATEDEALAQLRTIERLRVRHFGEAAARALFGEETAVTRELIELARLEKDPTLTLQQRVERAQARYQELRRLQAINESQRK
jgi:lipase chaperone LimK